MKLRLPGAMNAGGSDGSVDQGVPTDRDLVNGAVTTASVDILSIRGVEFSYPGGVQALGGVDLDIREGEVVTIVGPSGCGKSTLLAIVAGLESPTRGEIRWNDNLVGVGDRSRRRLTLVFQRDTLLPWLTAEKNVAFGLRYLKLSASERQERVTRLLQLAGLEDFGRAYPYQLSGGMRRRVAFLAGVAPLPRVLLLDEPFSALDEPTRVTIHAEVLSIVKELGMTVLLVTHDLGEAISLSDRVYLLSARPGVVAGMQDIPFGYPRNVLKVRETAEYQGLYRALWRELSLEIVKTRAEGS